jgi:hypothetical protein
MQRTWVAAVVLIVVAGSMGLLGLVTHPAVAPVPSTTSAHVTPTLLPPTHSDLVVGPGQLFVIQPTVSGPT